MNIERVMANVCYRHPIKEEKPLKDKGFYFSFMDKTEVTISEKNFPETLKKYAIEPLVTSPIANLKCSEKVKLNIKNGDDSSNISSNTSFMSQSTDISQKCRKKPTFFEQLGSRVKQSVQRVGRMALGLPTLAVCILPSALILVKPINRVIRTYYNKSWYHPKVVFKTFSIISKNLLNFISGSYIPPSNNQNSFMYNYLLRGFGVLNNCYQTLKISSKI